LLGMSYLTTSAPPGVPQVLATAGQRPPIVASPVPLSSPSPPLATAAAPQLKAPPAAGPALPQPIRYAAIGASDTVGIGTADPQHQNWTARLWAHLPPDTVYNRFARSGITLYEASQIELPAAIAFRPSLVSIWLVVNDALRGVPLPVYQKALKGMLDALTTQTDARIVLLNAPDLSGLLQASASPASRSQIRAIGANWNRVIAATAAPYGDRVLIADLFVPSEQARAHIDWISPDGFHPSAAGYQQIADVTYAALQKAGWVR
ncbi:MAG TPA: SGNH/GDSL hydrolase family protein, partial [Chloroflexia bacterium]|nr:SGNH/GDSL hydrolase family protein [Chloroflexia bacterium]